MNEQQLKKLQELEKTAQNFWNVPPEIGKLLNILVKKGQCKSILELGMSNGYSTIWLADAAKSINGHVTTTEYFENRIELAIKNFEECNLSDTITIKQGKILDTLNTLTDQYDFVFIDANKAEYKDYFLALQPLLASHAIIIADNVTSHREDVQPFLETLFSHKDFETVLLEIAQGITISYKRS